MSIIKMITTISKIIDESNIDSDDTDDNFLFDIITIQFIDHALLWYKDE